MTAYFPHLVFLLCSGTMFICPEPDQKPAFDENLLIGEWNYSYYLPNNTLLNAKITFLNDHTFIESVEVTIAESTTSTTLVKEGTWELLSSRVHFKFRYRGAEETKENEESIFIDDIDDAIYIFTSPIVESTIVTAMKKTG